MSDTTNEAVPTRRRWLRRTALGAALAAAAAGAGWKAWAAEGHGRHRGFMSGAMDPAEVEKRLERMLKHLYVEIDATEAQQQKLGPIVKSAAQDLMPVRTQLREARTQARSLLTGESIDRAGMEALRRKQVALAEAASKRLTEALADAAEVLTPAQRTQIAERLEQRRRRWHG